MTTPDHDATPAAPVTRHLTIRGRVQGVGYRYHCTQQATRLGLSGWVRNRRDGTVEALVHGPADAVQALIDWAHQGPAGARVEGVDVRPAPDSGEVVQGFTQRETV